MKSYDNKLHIRPIAFKNNSEKKITASRAFSLESGRILLQHQTQFDSPLALFEFPNDSTKYFFSVYDPKLPTNNEWIEGEYICTDLPYCYLPTGPVLSSLKDEIYFPDKRNALRSLFFCQEGLFYKEAQFYSHYSRFLRCTTLELNKYVFFNQRVEGASSIYLNICQEEKDQIRIVKTCHFVDHEVWNGICTLSPELLCVNTFNTFYLLHKEENDEFIEKSSFEIKSIAGQPARKFSFDIIDSISDHEIIVYACLHSESLEQKQVLIKINFDEKKSYELTCPEGISTHAVKYLTNSLFIIGENNEDGQSFFLFDAIEMVLVPWDLPEKSTLHSILPDGRLLLAQSPSKIILFADPFKQVKDKALVDVLDDIPLPLVNIISDYVERDFPIKLSTHFSSFHKPKIVETLTSDLFDAKKRIGM